MCKKAEENYMNRFHRLVASLTLLGALVTIVTLYPSQIKAQSTYGSIVGTVTDSSGAAVPNATVTVTNLGTNEARVAKSDGAGNYSAVNLLPATYKISVTAANFKGFLRQPVPVAVGNTVRIDAALQVGAATETVEVTTEAPLLQTDSSSMSQQIEGKTVQEMPLNGRNSMNLLALAAGVIPGGSTSGSPGGNQGQGHTSNVGFGNYQIGGALAGSGQMYVDGAPVNTLGGNLGGNVTALIPTQDAVQEFNVASNNVSAEFGRFGGGVINMATKGGTNAFHGTVYEYLRNSFFNANEWFNKASQLKAGKPNKPPQWNQNQYGFAVGGPILKDKAFFHFTWEGFKSDTGSITPTNVPTANMQNGIITESYKNTGTASSPVWALVPFQDPLGNCVITHQPGSQSAPGTWTITNLYTGSCGDPMAQVMRNYYPLPNNTNAIGQNNWTAVPATPDSQRQYNARIDYNLSARQRIFARYTYWAIEDAGFNVLGNYQGWLTENAKSLDYVQQAVVGDTITISPSTILDLHLAYLRADTPNSTVASLGMNFNKYPANSFMNQLSNSMTAHMIAQYTFGTASNGAQSYALYSFGKCCSIGHDWYNNYTVSASLTHIAGNHSIKVGGMITRLGDHSIAGGNSGTFQFNGQSTGDQWADFLLGYETGTGSSLTTQAPAYGYNYYQGYYIADTWQATKKLTVNLGMRWELPGGIFAGHDYNTVLLPNATDPTYNVQGTLALVNGPQYSSQSVINIKHGLFAPRVGFAYRLNNSTVVSGGYGISYMPIDVSTGGMPVKSPNISNPNSCGSPNATPNPAQLLYNCFNALNPIVGPPLRQANYFTMLKYYENTTKAMNEAYPYQKYPYTQQWNLSVSRQLPGNAMAEISYVGAAGIHLPASGANYNQIPDGSYTSAGLATTGPQAGLALTANGTCGTSKTLTVGQCLRPYPHYGNMRDTLAYYGQTNYHSLQVKGEKRFGAGGTLMGNFTWAKMIGDTDTQLNAAEGGTGGANSGAGGAPAYQDYTYLRGERSTVTYDVPFRAVFSYILNLPFGKGQRFGANANPVMSRAISGWGINGITTLQHGFHLPMKAGGTPVLNQSFGTGTIRPNYAAGCSKASPLSGNAKIAEWFNTSCWTAAPAYTFGNERRVDANVFQEGIKNFDLSFLKATPITERIAMQFRAEFFNVFNRKQFTQPDSTIGDPTYGQVTATINQPRLVQFSLRVNF